MKTMRNVLIVSAMTIVVVVGIVRIWIILPARSNTSEAVMAKQAVTQLEAQVVAYSQADDGKLKYEQAIKEAVASKSEYQAKLVALEDKAKVAEARAQKAEQASEVAMKLSQLLEAQKAKAVDDLNDQVTKLEAEKRKLQADATVPGTTQAVELQAQVLELTGKLATSEANVKSEIKLRAAAESRIAKAEFLAKSAQQQLERMTENTRGTKPKMGTDKGAW